MRGFEVGFYQRGGGFTPVVYLVTKRGVRHSIWEGVESTHTEEEAEAVALARLVDRLKQLMS